MTRRAALTLLSLCMLAAAALACNLPGIAKQTDVTETALANATQTAVMEATTSALQTSLLLTQTALIPTATSTATDIPSATAASTVNAAAAVTGQATGAATTNATGAPNKAGGTPTQTSIANGSLKVGVEATVNTAGGAPLNMRDNPGLKGNLITRLPSDSRVKIVDGPQTADGFLWWKVNVLTSSVTGAIGKTGWCAELAAGAQTLVAAK